MVGSVPGTRVRVPWLQALAVAAALALGLSFPAAASAESIAFVKDHTVWLVAPDGSGARAVSGHGTQASPFGYVSQADDGTLYATKVIASNCQPGSGEGSINCDRADTLWRMDRTGRVLGNTFNPDQCGRALSDIDVSPDGRYIAYSVAPARNSCTASPRGVAVSPAGGDSAVAAVRFDQDCKTPHWASATKLLIACSRAIDMVDMATGLRRVWFELRDGAFGDFMAMPAASQDRVAVVPSTQRTMDLVAVSAPPPDGTPGSFCTFAPPDGNIRSPSWRPDGTALVSELFQTATRSDLFVGPVVGFPQSCPPAPSLLAAGGKDPDWGPADVGATAPGAGTAPVPGVAPGLRLAISAAARGSLRTARTRGVAVSATCDAACSLVVDLRLDAATARKLKLPVRVGRATASAQAGSRKRIVVRFTSGAKPRLRRVRRVSLTLVVNARAATGSSQATKRVTLRQR